MEAPADQSAAHPPERHRRPPGILCPNCGVKLRTLRVKPRRDGSVQRKKECRQCGYRKTTFER